ncbi:MAG: RsmE family RNA methyltransferase, partial [Chloroflexi bacterium]|nr:RsmE family RNA methyltransferase [Chloroflexota bacterium]
MTAPHFFAADVSGEKVLIQGDDARHALRVLRLKPGERITISDGRGEVVDAAVQGDRDVLVASVLARRTELPARPALDVFHAIPKKGKLDLVVQKLTELGARSVRLVASDRSVPRWD